MQINLDEKDLEAIAAKLAAHLLPLLKDKRSEADTILDINEAAALLKVSKEQIYQWANKSQYGLSDFPVMRAGRLLRFSKNDLITWLKSKNNG